MLSRPDVYSRLAGGFVGVRFDWEQGNHYKDKIGFVLGTGDQLLLKPTGEVIPPGLGMDGKPAQVYGRHGRDTTATVLDEVLARHPPEAGEPELKIEWFFWPRLPARGGKGVYPVPYQSAAGYARLPLALVEGPIPEALRDPAFLRWHVRQFIWVRGEAEGPSRIVVRRVRDGLKAGLPEELASLDPAAMDKGHLGAALDAAWLAYMKDRPMVARGYLDNPHGGWMRGRREQMVGEEEALRRKARDGTLLPPGRKPEEGRPY